MLPYFFYIWSGHLVVSWFSTKSKDPMFKTTRQVHDELLASEPLKLIKWVLVVCGSFTVEVNQLTFPCSKLTVGTLEKGMKYVKVNSNVVFLLLTLNLFHTFF